MNARIVLNGTAKALSGLLLGMALAMGGMSAAHAELAPDVQAKVDGYKKKLVEWAANPTIVAAVKESNGKGGLVAGMSNAKWDDLAETDPVVKGFQSSAAGKLMSQWEADKTLDKLYVRDAKGNLVAGSNKPLLYNNANRPPFANPFKGQPWAAGEAKPDPTTQKKSVQLGVPIMDGGTPIGVLQTAVLVD